MAIKDYGPVTEYAIAVQGGFTGTYNEWVQLVAASGTNAVAVQQALTNIQNQIDDLKCPTSTDGTFILKCTVTDGTPVYNWIEEE